MRQSKNIHLLAILRRDLGGLTQADVAFVAKVSTRTIRDVELCAHRMSRPVAENIGYYYDVDPDCLIRNDLSRGLRTLEGRRWSSKTRKDVRSRLKRWGDLAPEARRIQQEITAVLLEQYLLIAHLIRKLPDPSWQLIKWSQLFNVAKTALAFSEPATKGWKAVELLCEDGLEVVLDDTTAVLADVQLVKRIRKRQQPSRSNETTELKRLYVQLFGWNERGIVAANLFDELGRERIENMKLFEFARLVQDRCEKAGINWPQPFDPFEAIKAWQDYFKAKT
jgi:hypothetical protein